ncbi:MAG: hypothetical protein ACKVX7_19190 [Planctomycetota bacterium]
MQNAPISPEPPATNRPAWIDEVAELYRAVDREIDPHQHLCKLSGVCCDFRKSDHVLYTTSVEVGYALATRTAPWTTQDDLCPFWRGGLCTARAERPLGCRTYFCDPTWRERGEEIHERFHAQLIAIGERHGVRYSYSPWVASMAAAAASRSVAGGAPVDGSSLAVRTRRPTD